jgi:hypothetical protein
MKYVRLPSVEDTSSAPAVSNQPRAVPPLLIQPLAVQSHARPPALGSRTIHQIEIATHGASTRRSKTSSPSQLRGVEHLILQRRSREGTAATRSPACASKWRGNVNTAVQTRAAAAGEGRGSSLHAHGIGETACRAEGRAGSCAARITGRCYVLCFFLRRCGPAHGWEAQGVPLLWCEGDVFAIVGAAEDRGEGYGHVDEEEQLDCVEDVGCVWRVADGADGDAGMWC